MRTLDIDIETYSSVALGDCGVYKYVESTDFDIILFSWSEDDGPVQVADIALGEKIPAYIVQAIYDPEVTKYAHNAAFEMCCLSKYLGHEVDVRQWDCTMVMCARMGFPLALGQAAAVLHLDQQKMKEGKNLIRYFCQPATSGKNAGNRNEPQLHLDKWQVFKDYCLQDVATEGAIRRRLQGLIEVPAWERRLYEIDYEINRRGVAVDIDLARKAVAMSEEKDAELLQEARELTGLDNPKSVAQASEWVRAKQMLSKAPGLNKDAVKDMLKNWSLLPEVKQYLAIRSQLAKTSVKKYQAVLDAVCADGRIHGILQYYGTFTGRWAGRLVQMQNLPQNHLKEIGAARAMLKEGDRDAIELIYGDVKQTLSELIRTTFIPKPGYVFHVCDFSAIEARVLAWLAGEEWVVEVFRTHGKIYEATASQMYHVPVSEITKGDPRRQRGKIATLALGYGGGVGALEAMDPAGVIPEAEKKSTVRMWRQANLHIVHFWQAVEEAALKAINTGITQTIHKGLRLGYKKGCMTVTLPSGRTIVYPRVRIEQEEMMYGGIKPTISYERLNQETRQWGRARTYGGKLTENIVQSIARDILATVLMREHDAGLNVVFHVHDETITECPTSVPLEQIEAIFSEPIPWAEGLPLKGAGYSGSFYFKD